METVATFTVPEDAHLFRTFLESRGVEGFVLGEHFVQLFWHYSNAVGGVRVVVDELDSEQAEDLYREYMEAIREGDYQVRPARAWPMVLLLSLVFGVPFMIFGRQAATPET